MQTDYIDIYQLHNVKTEQEYAEVMSPNGAYKALLEAKASGKIGYIGITSHNVDFGKYHRRLSVSYDSGSLIM